MEYKAIKIFAIIKTATKEDGSCWVEVKEVVNLEELSPYEWYTNEIYEIINSVRETRICDMEVGDIIISPTEGERYILSRIG